MSRPLDRFFADRARSGSSRKRRVRLPLARSVGRVRSLLIVVAVVFSLAAGRAVQVQAIDANNVAAEAADQMTVSHVLPAFRGTITDRNGEVLAQTQDTVKVIADARQIRTNGRGSAPLSDADREAAAAAPAKIAAILVQYLGGVPEDYLPRLTASGTGESYQPIRQKVPAATYRQIIAAMAEQKLVGLRSENQPTRVYPNGVLAANILGFVNDNGDGASGLEFALDKAYTAATMRKGTEAFFERMTSSPSLTLGFQNRARLMVWGGGLPIVHEGAVVGGIGVSGAQDFEDVACAKAALAAQGLGWEP